jgi:hypothetical protein
MMSRDALLRALERHVAWQDAQGPLSQDQYDVWAAPVGQRAKRRFYAHRFSGRVAAAPLVALDTLVPRARGRLWPPTRFPIADAHYVMGHVAFAGLSGDREAGVARARDHVAALLQSRCPDQTEYCWGYPFDWVTTWGTWPSGTPLITTTPYVYEAMEAFHETTGEPEWPAVMESIARWAHDGLEQTDTAPGRQATAYSPLDSRRVVNASAYRGFLLASAGRRFGRDDWTEAARRNLGFVVDAQQPDGSWFYAMDGKDAFVDNFHTCFVLKSLIKAGRALGDNSLRDAVVTGLSFYRTALLDESGLPRSFAVTQRLNLVRRELYDFAEGINLALLAEEDRLDGGAPAILERLADELLTRWQLPDGHFVTRLTRLGRNTVPYHRWAQAQTFRALALVAAHRS